MKPSSSIGLVAIALVAGWLGNGYLNTKTTTAAVKETTYDRVMRTQTIRCGYALWAPLMIKDPNTGVLSGSIHDYMEALGHALNLKIEWAEETGWGDFPAALESGRIDTFCAGVWPNASRARQADFTQPISYQTMYAYGRSDDRRFDDNLTAINNPSVTITALDGEVAALIASTDFPKAKTLQMSQLATGAETLTATAAGKADVTFTDPATVAQFEANNPGKIRRITTKTPLRIFGNTIAVARKQEEFRQMLNSATQELLFNGQIEKILAKYEQYPGTFLRVAPNYLVDERAN